MPDHPWTRPNAKSKRLAMTSLGRRPIRLRLALSRVEVAKAAVAALPPPQSATPLADYTGVPEWMLDVFEALTISFAINLPASALVALGVKLGRPRLQIQEATERTITIEAMPSEAEREPELCCRRFGLAMLRPEPNAKLAPGDLRAAYIGWCRENGSDPLPIKDIAPALGKLFRKAGIDIADGSAVGVTIKQTWTR